MTAKVQYNSITRSAPAWASDGIGGDTLIPGGGRLDAGQFNATDAVVVTLTSTAAADATSMAVSALSGAIPSGTILYFGESKELAMLTAAAAAGATSLTVQALPTQIESGDSATYAGAGLALKTVVSGTLIGRTYAERDAGTGFGPWSSSDDEVYLLAQDVTDVADLADCELYRHNCVVRENALPGWSTLGSTAKTKIRALYQCIYAA